MPKTRPNRLPGEGDVETITRKRIRYRCNWCDELAQYKIIYLLDSAQSGIKGYFDENCGWDEDDSRFACAEHRQKAEQETPVAMHLRGVVSASPRLSHVFLSWETQKAQGETHA